MKSSNTSKVRGAGLLAAGALLGVVSAGAVGAYAVSNNSSGSSSTSSSASSAPARDTDGVGKGGGHAGETPLTGSNLQKATTAAKAAVKGGIVDRAETDSGDSPYEVHMTKSDGTKVTVKLDKSFAVKSVEDGMGK